MKKLFLFSMLALGILIFGCVKSTNLPAYTPPVTTNFSVSSLKHTADTVNLGDTIYLTAIGTIYDTTKNIYVYVPLVHPLQEYRHFLLAVLQPPLN